jgi:hypothetical protein
MRRRFHNIVEMRRFILLLACLVGILPSARGQEVTPGCTDTERDAVEWARKLAAGRVQDVWFLLYGPASTPRSDTRLDAAKAYAKLFFGDNIFTPDANGQLYDVAGVLEKMRNRLITGLQFECVPSVEKVKAWKGTPDQQPMIVEILKKAENCAGRAGYVADHKPPIYLCEPFFAASPESKVRTLIHESAHLAGVSETVGESYCGGGMTIVANGPATTNGGFDCETPCGGRNINIADNWSHFIHCVWLTGDSQKAAGLKPDGN